MWSVEPHLKCGGAGTKKKEAKTTPSHKHSHVPVPDLITQYRAVVEFTPFHFLFFCDFAPRFLSNYFTKRVTPGQSKIIPGFIFFLYFITH